MKSDGLSLAEGIGQTANGREGDARVELAISICSFPSNDPSQIRHFLVHGTAGICFHGNGWAICAWVESGTDAAIRGREEGMPGQALKAELYHEHGHLARSVEWYSTPARGYAQRLLASGLPRLLSRPRAAIG
jgi:hypothetical protein